MPNRSPEDLEAELVAMKARLDALAGGVGRLSNNQQGRMAGERIAEAVRTAMPASAPPPPAPSVSDMVRAYGPTVTLVGFLAAAVIGFGDWRAAQTRAEGVASTRATALELRLATLEQRQLLLDGLPGRIQAIESSTANTRQNRDNQYQALADRVRGLETSDQVGVQQVQGLANTIAGILPRLEEILRRQGELERQLRGRPMRDDDALMPFPPGLPPAPLGWVLPTS